MRKTESRFEQSQTYQTLRLSFRVFFFLGGGAVVGSDFGFSFKPCTCKHQIFTMFGPNAVRSYRKTADVVFAQFFLSFRKMLDYHEIVCIGVVQFVLLAHQQCWPTVMQI